MKEIDSEGISIFVSRALWFFVWSKIFLRNMLQTDMKIVYAEKEPNWMENMWEKGRGKVRGKEEVKRGKPFKN